MCRQFPTLDVDKYSDCLVAVKVLPPFVDDMGIVDFIQEINFMKTLGIHPNLIQLLGTSTYRRDAQQHLVVEYCENGDLLHLIRRRRREIIAGVVSDFDFGFSVRIHLIIRAHLDHYNRY